MQGKGPAPTPLCLLATPGNQLCPELWGSDAVLVTVEHVGVEPRVLP